MINQKNFLLLILVIISIIIIKSYFQPIESYQEARKALIVKETSNGSFWFPTYNGVPYCTKPPLSTWISIPFFKLFSFLENGEVFSLRLVSIFCYILLAISLYFFLEKDLNKVILSFLILFGSYRFLSFISRIDLEPLFILFSFFMICSGYLYIKKNSDRYRMMFYLFLGLTFMIRGPLNWFIIPALIIYGLLYKEKKIFNLLIYPLGWLVSCLIILPWYASAYLKFGSAFFDEFLGIDIGDRLTASEKSPFYYYFKALIVNFCPYFLLLFVSIIKFKQEFLKQLKDKKLGFVLVLALIPVILLSFTGQKYDKYLLYLYPLWSLVFLIMLSKYYSYRFLKNLSLIIFSVTFLAYFIVEIYNLKERSYKIELLKNSIINTHNIVFWEKENPLMVFYYNKPVKVVKNKNELLSYAQKNKIISPEIIPWSTVEKVILDPYKNEKWYILTIKKN
ncbi:ArnT family glycosyltransferase [Thermodesulfovibrio thiophilus]|uniref:ArnT family glycosyltransferase n=1 Tax=Thermodesulfovibrio thiophilus TaxID=340095 RepID=UPI000400BB02|nr:glycosyltransferase family 39 protein [Thermodesulfovibrio thiophilus]